MSEKFDIHVYQDEESSTFHVWPPTAVVTAGQKLTVCNLTGHPITLTFPARVIRDGRTFRVGKGKGRVLKIAAPGNSLPVIYDYDVVVTLTNKIKPRALGNSWPKIIVDP
jgi:hypothetical protein